MRPIYLDYNATTPVDPDVLQAMLPYLRGEFGNPSSSYELGRRARDAIENARAEVASLIGALPDEIVFTGGGTEASNIAIRSGAAGMPGRKAVVTTTIEHPATDACCALLACEGFDIRRVAVDGDAVVAAHDFTAAVDRNTALVSVIHAQNEIGTLQPVAEIASIAKAAGALMHADAAQSVGKVPVDVRGLGVDLLSIAGHKLYAPKGIGALYMRRDLDLPSVLVGAGQEHGRRPGTENVAFIVALGEACRLAAMRVEAGAAHMRSLTERLLRQLTAEIPEIVRVGDADRRLPNTLNVLFPGVSGRKLLEACPRVSASTGSACHADREEPSAILLATGLKPERAIGAVRLSVGAHTTLDEIDAAAASLVSAWRVLRYPTDADPARIPAL
ncbi:MAG: cysteine desulfurase family protein [Pseudorhodoplanes sp.]